MDGPQFLFQPPTGVYLHNLQSFANTDSAALSNSVHSLFCIQLHVCGLHAGSNNMCTFVLTDTPKL